MTIWFSLAKWHLSQSKYSAAVDLTTAMYCVLEKKPNGHNFRAYQVTNLKTLEEETCKQALQVCIDIKSRVKEMFPLFIFHCLLC